MLTGPRINTCFVTPSHILLLTYRGKNIYNIIQCTAIFCGLSNVKSLTQDGGQLSHFPQSVSPTPSPDSTLNPTYTLVVKFQNWQKMTPAHRKSSWADSVLSGTLSYAESLVLPKSSPESCVWFVPSIKSFFFLLILVIHLSFKSPLPFSES